jgi:hypothetical protein
MLTSARVRVGFRPAYSGVELEMSFQDCWLRCRNAPTSRLLRTGNSWTEIRAQLLQFSNCHHSLFLGSHTSSWPLGAGKPILTARASGYACFNIAMHRLANGSSAASGTTHRKSHNSEPAHATGSPRRRGRNYSKSSGLWKSKNAHSQTFRRRRPDAGARALQRRR